jgi:hypothetical protein
VFVTGISKPAQDDPIASTYQVFFLSIIVDQTNDRVIDATCNMASDMTKDFIHSLLVGQDLAQGVEEMVALIRRRFYGLAQKALIVALKDAHNRYMMVKRGTV